jgi:hypothetical protein
MAFFLVFLVTLSTVDSWAPPGNYNLLIGLLQEVPLPMRKILFGVR